MRLYVVKATHDFLSPAEGEEVPPGVAVVVRLAADPVPEHIGLLLSEGAARRVYAAVAADLAGEEHLVGIDAGAGGGARRRDEVFVVLK